MHMILRHILWFFKKFTDSKIELKEASSIQMRVLPTDLDFLWHVNNGVYFSFMDFGRMNMIFRNGIFDLAQKNGWYGVVASETMKFKRSLQLWDKFTLQTQMTGYDDKYFYITQKFILKDTVVAQGLVKIRFLSKKGGGVSTQEIIKATGESLENHSPELGDAWSKIESQYLT
jgi:YbgC/YbaW family acyl-CoA thioester hydrolase